MITLSLPFPPSVNGYWRSFNGRQIVSAKGRAYKKAVAGHVLIAGLRKPMAGKLHCNIVLYMPDRRRRDIDNYSKCLLDALVSAGVMEDDSQIRELRILDNGVEPPGKVVVTLQKLGVI